MKGRRNTFIVLTALLGLGIGAGAFAFLSLTAPWFGFPEDREVHRVHDLAYGGQAGILLAIPLLLQAVNPERKPALMLVAAASVLGFAAGYALGEPQVFLLVPAVVVALLWWLHPARREVRLTGPVDPLMVALTVLAAIPLVMYAFDQAAIQRACVDGNQHCEEFHYSGMAALAFVLPLAGLVSSFRTRGWRIAAWLTAVAAVDFGLAAILLPDHPSSVGTTWGSVALAGGILFVAAAELRARRPASHPASS